MFTEAAGNKTLDSCPGLTSCGTYYPYWTDGTMPTVVGVETTVTAYGVYKTDCRNIQMQVKVMRCSWDTPHDLIYKQTSNYTGTCHEAFCRTM